ncbi:MAG: phage tail protein [Planctomycetota bacterium]|jgi:microcystin-dependent protein
MKRVKVFTILVFVLLCQLSLVGMAAGERPSIAGLQAQIDALMMVGRPFIGEIKVFSGNFEPDGWLYCNGLLMPIYKYPELFSVIGNTYGGDGRMTFALPDLRGRVPIGEGAGAGLTNRLLGQEGGAENVILSESQLPSHDHSLRATNSSATQTQPSGNVLATAPTPQYLNATTSVLMGTDSIGSTGSNAPHANVQPFSVLQFIIAVDNRVARFPYTASTWNVQEANTPGVAIATDYEFTSAAVVYLGLEYLLHVPGSGNVWVAVPKNHNLATGPTTPRIVLEPHGGDMTESRPAPRWPVRRASGTSIAVTTDDEFTSGGVDYIGLEYLALDVGTGSIWVALRKNHDLEKGPGTPMIVLDPTNKFIDRRVIPGPHWRVDSYNKVYGGLKYTSAAVDYIALEYLVHSQGIGTIWVAIPESYNLMTGPLTPVINLAPDVVTPN